MRLTAPVLMLVAFAPLGHQLPPLSFSGFRPGMPVSDAVSLIRAAKGSLTCKSTTDARMKDCTGVLPESALAPSLDVLISSIKDSAAVIVFSHHGGTSPVTRWVTALTRSFGRPNHQEGSSQSTWQWIRAGTMLRVVQRNLGARREASVTLTHGPLLDGLGSTPASRSP